MDREALLKMDPNILVSILIKTRKNFKNKNYF